MGYGAAPARFQARLKKMPNKNHDSGAKRRAKRERSEHRDLASALETWIDITFFRPARARCAGGPARRQTFRAGARLPLGQCGMLCRTAHERDADLQREPVAHLGADDQFRKALLLSLGPPRRQRRSDRWLDDDLRPRLQHDRRARRPAWGRRRPRRAWLSLLGNAAA